MAVEITGITTTPLSDKKTDDSATAASSVTSRGNQDSERTVSTLNTSPVGSTDKVTLTQQAEELRMIEKAVNEQTGIDSERVENLKIEIDNGRYDVDSQRVAEKLIEFEALFVA